MSHTLLGSGVTCAKLFSPDASLYLPYCWKLHLSINPSPGKSIIEQQQEKKTQQIHVNTLHLINPVWLFSCVQHEL